jgi:hypothetical protein
MKALILAAATATSISISLPAAATAIFKQNPSTVELVYVANADDGPVTAYPADSTGDVRPVRRLFSPNDPQTYWQPWGITFDGRANAYVQTFLSDATTFVFPPNSSRPSRMFQVTAPGFGSHCGRRTGLRVRDRR